MNPGRRFLALDGLRFVGALAVLTTHVGFASGDALRGPFAGILSRLDAGVALFFVVSGFLLFRPHAMAHLEGRSRPSPLRYYLRRAARILPPLWIAVGAAALLIPGAGSEAGDYIAHATLTQIYLDTPLTPGLTQFWSLATEVAFYLLLPVIASLASSGRPDAQWCRRVILACAVMPAVGAAWMASATALGHSAARLWLPGYVGWFAIGIGLATWHAGRTTGTLPASRFEELTRFPGTVWSLLAAVFLLSTSAVAGPLDLSEPTPGQAATKSLLYSIIGLLAVAPTVMAIPPAREPAALAPLTGRVGVWLGQISYGVFAYHVVILELLGEAPGFEPFTGRFMARWVVTLAAALVVAWLSYRFVERPIMRSVRVRRRRVPDHSTVRTDVQTNA
ncbi:MAG TPA: acyltransferase [Intrasporangium sp.]|uniref:acyltransferase family protein n=1 Tax=Intrasporangium sp. TaxID=1925024 RepID=UPI002B496995|nr:acyltransferase [Intrasporangium sp.]HKX65848.1 acyltransferase [Intrasporangium sp.]